jgi:hypothetical protein
MSDDADDSDRELEELLVRWSKKHNRRYVCIFEVADGSTATLYRSDLDPEMIMRTVLSYGPAPETQLIHEDENGERVVHTIVRNTQH